MSRPCTTVGSRGLSKTRKWALKVSNECGDFWLFTWLCPFCSQRSSIPPFFVGIAPFCGKKRISVGFSIGLVVLGPIYHSEQNFSSPLPCFLKWAYWCVSFGASEFRLASGQREAMCFGWTCLKEHTKLLQFFCSSSYWRQHWSCILLLYVSAHNRRWEHFWVQFCPHVVYTAGKHASKSS